MKTRSKFIATAALFGACLFGPAAVAYATTPNRVTPGAACETIGSVGVHKGQAYRCEQRRGETCGHWHWVYDGTVPKGTRTAWPVGPCCGATPTASPSASATPKPALSATPSTSASTPAPTDSPSTAASPTTTTGGSLPITGPSGWLALAGATLLALGVRLYLAGRVQQP